MLKVENYNCQYLKLSSDIISNIRNNQVNGLPALFSKVELTYSINCGDNITEELFLQNSSIWTYGLSIHMAKADIIEEISFKHIISGEVFTKSNLTIDVLSATSTDYFNIMNNLLITNGFDPVGSGFAVNINSNVLELSGVPSGVLPFSIKVKDSEEIFLFNFQNQDSFFSMLDFIYLKPASFNLINLLDSVYKIKLKYIKTDGSFIEESQCFFADCTIKCKIAALLEDALENDSINSDIYLYYSALNNSGNCGGCNCEDMCEVYQRLMQYLNNPLIITKLKNNCCNGCN